MSKARKGGGKGPNGPDSSQPPPSQDGPAAEAEAKAKADAEAEAAKAEAAKAEAAKAEAQAAMEDLEASEAEEMAEAAEVERDALDKAKAKAKAQDKADLSTMVRVEVTGPGTVSYEGRFCKIGEKISLTLSKVKQLEKHGCYIKRV